MPAIAGRVDCGGNGTADLESLEATIEILAAVDTMRRLHASHAELARGEIENRHDLEAAMERRCGTPR